MKARDAALNTLIQISNDKAYSNLEVNKLIKENKISPKDRGLYISLVYGTLQRLLTIDSILKDFITRGYQKLNIKIRWILRIAVFQILYLDSIPDYAIVNEAVKQTKKVNHRQSGFVNGVLHSIIRDREQVKQRLKNQSNKEIKYSVPNWIIDKYFKTYGDKTDRILDKINEAPDLYIRVKPENFDEVFNHLTALGAKPEKDKDLDKNGLIIKNPGAFKGGVAGSELFKKGLFTVQDKGAIQIGLALNPLPGENVLDICAAPGGKTTHLAEQMQNKGHIDALDLHKHRSELIELNAKRLNLDNINVAVQDASIFNPNLVNKYDKVLVDAPCSGLGIIRRKPEIRYKMKPESLKSIEDIQYKILKNAFAYLKKNGTLIYSTCTVNPDENEKLVDKLKGEFGEEVLIQSHNYTSTLDNSDGFYYAIITKE